MKFYSRLNPAPVIEAPAGSKEATTYQTQIDENGHKVTVPIGKTNIYDRIQSSLEETKIENIIKRFTEGDISAFRQGEPLYADMTEAPKTLMEAQNMIIRITDEFNNLPVEVRAKFDHSPEKYVAQYGSEQWAEAVGYEIKKAATGEIPGTGDVSTEPIPSKEEKA